MRISLVAICLLVMPWSVVLTSHIALRSTPKQALYDGNDLIEIGSLSNALRIYRDRYREYPPDFSTGDPKTEIEQHLKKAFPNRLAAVDLPQDTSGLGPHNALHFWLRGFSVDPERPLTGPERGTFPLYKFNWNRLKGEVYYSRAGKAPFVYFRSNTYATAQCDVPGCGTAYPYLSSDSSRDHAIFEEGRRFQIISAGVDGNFGSGQVTSGATIFGGHADNLTNFKDGPLGDASIEQRRAHLTRTRNLSLLAAVVCLAAYPCVVLLQRRADGVQELRKLVSRQASEKPLTSRWKGILTAHRKRHKSEAIRRMSNVGD